MLWKFLAAAASLCLAAAPLSAQQTPAPTSVPAPADEEVPEQRDGAGVIWFYLAFPILAVLIAALGFALGGDEEEAPASS